MTITPDDILKYCLDNLDGTVEINSWGERGIFYNPGGVSVSYTHLTLPTICSV